MKIPAAISTAQACIESGYGTAVPKDISSGKFSYNLFGIKEFGNKSYVTIWTHEYENGEKVLKKANFRAYKNYNESLKAHAKLLKKYRPSKKSNKAWAKSLKKKGYATNPNYDKDIMEMIKFLELK